VTSSPTWPTLETFVRQHVQRCLQQVLEEEVEALRGLLGDGVPLSASADQRLTLDWQRQYAA